MNNLVIGHPEVFAETEQPNSQIVNVSGMDITFGLLNTQVPDFDPIASPNKILIKKLAFSCNYRDMAGCMLIFNSCIKNSNEYNHVYSGFGSEFVAEVIAIGCLVNQFKIGDRVIPNGEYPSMRKRSPAGLPTNFASEIFSEFDEEQFLKVPNEIDDATAASLTIAGQTVYSILRRANLQHGQNVLITAASSNTSLFAMESLKAKNITTIGLTSSEEKIQSLKKLGYDHVVISPQIDSKPLNQLYKEIGGVDVVIDPFYDLYLEHIVDYMNNFGKYYTCGLYKQVSSFQSKFGEEGNESKYLFKILVKNISIIGNCLGSTIDLQNAIQDVSRAATKIHIDTIFESNSYGEFIKRSFMDSTRLGKVVYKY